MRMKRTERSMIFGANRRLANRSILQENNPDAAFMHEIPKRMGGREGSSVAP